MLVWVMARPICAFMRDFNEHLNMMVALLVPNEQGRPQAGGGAASSPCSSLYGVVNLCECSSAEGWERRDGG